MNPLKVILALSGGGCRGKLSSEFLEYLELLLGYSLTNAVSLFAGTSTGAIQACCLASGLYSAKQLSQFYTDHGETIFPPAWEVTKRWRRWWSGCMYDHRPLEELLQQFLQKPDGSGEPLLMGDVVKPVICETYEWTTDRPVTLTNWTHSTLPMWQACRASSAAPSYFEGAEVSLNGQEPVFLVDGGMDCNAPGVDAVAHLYLNDGVPLSDMAVISIGTGRPRKHTSIEKLRGAPLVKRLPKIFNTAMSTERTSQQLRVLEDRYVEIDCDLADGVDASMDNGSPQQMRSLAQEAAAFIDRNPGPFERAVELLKRAA